MIRTIHVALKTAQVRNAGTNSAPVLTITQEDIDLLELTLPLENGLEEGKAIYFSMDVSQFNLELSNYYVRLGIRGADAWLPEYAFVWVEKDPQYIGDPAVQPLALKVYASELLSTTEKEGRLSVPLTRAYYGGFYNEIQFIFVLVKTDDNFRAGTKGPVWLSVRNKNEEALRVPLTGPGALESDSVYMANFGVNPFNFADLRSIDLTIEGADAWLPEQVMIFAYQQQYAEQKSMTPVVYIPNWKKAGLPQMSTDPKEGQSTVTLYQAYL